jgi:hypothetical protein
MKYAVAILLAASISTPALAEDCQASFAARLADAKRAVIARDAYVEQHQAEYRAATWFTDHCRFLSELEIAIRKLDDPRAFVCEKARGRPKHLSADVVANFGSAPLVSQFQAEDFYGPNHMCMDQDRAHGVALVGLDEMTPIQKLEFLCAGDGSEKCLKARASTEAARVKGHQ